MQRFLLFLNFLFCAISKEKKFKTLILKFPSTVLLSGHSVLEGHDIILHTSSYWPDLLLHLPAGAKSIIVFMFIYFLLQATFKGWTDIMHAAVDVGKVSLCSAML